MNPWIYIIVGGFFETVWAVCMKESEGFTDLFWTILTLIFLVVSTLFLNKGLVADLPAGPSYSVWVGIGAIGSLIAGVVLFDEYLSPIKIAFVILIIAGVLGIEREHSRNKETGSIRSVYQFVLYIP